MTTELAALIAFVAAGLTTLAAVPALRGQLIRRGVVDLPDGRRKLHGAVIPRGGGVAVLGGFLVAIAAAAAVGGAFPDPGFLAAFLVAAVFLCGVGLLDDAVGLRGRQKLLAQVAAACLVAGYGGTIHGVEVFGFQLDLGPLALPFTILWLLGAINAVNLLDGLDGFAGVISMVIGTALVAVSLHTGHSAEAIYSAALVGAVLGFLRYNFPPASIFLGDAGSMVIGLILGTIAYRGSMKGPAILGLTVPVAVWALPAFDVLMAIVRRRLTGRSIYMTDRGHLHHRLVERGLATPVILALVALLSGITAAASLASLLMKQEWIAVVGVLTVCGVLVGGRLFGHSEARLIVTRGRSLAQSMVPRRSGGLQQPPARVARTRLNGEREWESLWATLVTFAERFGLHRLSLDVNHPALKEEYFATWSRDEMPPPGESWRSDIPLMSAVGPVGHLRIVGRCGDRPVCEWMGELIAGLQPFESQMLDLLEVRIDAAHTEPPPPAELRERHAVVAR